MTRKNQGAEDGWTVVWEGQEPTAGSAEEMLHGNGLEVRRQKLDSIRLSVPAADADTAKELLKDWGL